MPVKHLSHFRAHMGWNWGKQTLCQFYPEGRRLDPNRVPYGVLEGEQEGIETEVRRSLGVGLRFGYLTVPKRDMEAHEREVEPVMLFHST